MTVSVTEVCQPM